MPDWLRKVVCCKKIRVYDVGHYVDGFHSHKGMVNKWTSTNEQKSFNDFQQLCEAIDKLNRHLEHYQRMEQRNHQWTVIFDRIDLAFFLGFQLIHLIQFLIVMIARTNLLVLPSF